MIISPKKFSPKRLRRMRELARITQMELADRIGGYQGQVCAWERGRVIPNSASVDALCAALRCNTEDLHE